MKMDRTARRISRWLGAVLVAAVLVSMLPTLVAPQTAAAATTSLTVTRYDAHGNVVGTRTVDYLWLEANLPVQGDGETRYYAQGPTFTNTSFGAVWNPAEDVNVDTRDYGRPKGTDVKDLCNLVGGAPSGCTVKIRAADNFSKWFDYEDIYNPEPQQGKLVVCWYNADFGGYVPSYDTGMRLLFFADNSTNPMVWQAFGDWDMHETLPESRWHYYSGIWPSSSGLSVKTVSNVDIYEPNMVSCDASGAAKEVFAPGETVYVKGAGLAAGMSYQLWTQAEPVSNNRIVIVDGNDPVHASDYVLDAGNDPSGAREAVTSDAGGDFGPTAIWTVDTAAAAMKYDIVADSQAAGTVGMYDRQDFMDAPGWEGFTVAGTPVYAPSAAFSANPVSGMAPLMVQFADESTENPAAWAWDFDNDGATDSTSQNPSHVYSVPGSYTVKLTSSNAIGSDSEVKTDYITSAAPPLPAAEFSADVISGPAPLAVQFTDESTGAPASWAWDFDNDGTVDGTAQNPGYTYDAAGTYTVKLTVTNITGSDSEVKADYITVTVPEMALLWGPYVTATSTTTAVVNVKTTLATAVTVEYATEAFYTAGGTYDQADTDAAGTELHHSTLSGLRPDTVYHYRVLYGGEASADCHFRTFPTSGPVDFVVVSDTQDQLPLFSQSERFHLVADSIAAQPDVAFVLITGDLVNDGGDLACWDRFFEAGREMLTGTTIYTAPGNHEDHDPLYYEIFGLPAYYSFDCGDAHFTVLDSTGDTAAQAAWLENDLDSSKPWKFAGFHHPFYTSDPNHFGGYANLRSEWEALFLTHGVDAVWNGHMHTYERYVENSIHYMVMGTGGGPLYQLGDERYDGYQNDLQNGLAYSRVALDPSAGTATVDIVRVADISLDNSAVTMVYPPGTVFETVTMTQTRPGWDLNGDGVCNIGDVVVVGLHWDETGAPGWIPEDLNSDGVINIGDVVVLGLYWGDRW